MLNCLALIVAIIKSLNSLVRDCNKFWFKLNLFITFVNKYRFEISLLQQCCKYMTHATNAITEPFGVCTFVCEYFKCLLQLRPTKCEMHAVIHFLSAKNMNAPDIRRQISKVCAENIMTDGEVQKCVRAYKDCFSTFQCQSSLLSGQSNSRHDHMTRLGTA